MNDINTIVKKSKGRPKLTDEQKLLQIEKRKQYQRNYRIEKKEQLKEKRDKYINKNIDTNHMINRIKELEIQNEKIKKEKETEVEKIKKENDKYERE